MPGMIYVDPYTAQRQTQNQMFSLLQNLALMKISQNFQEKQMAIQAQMAGYQEQRPTTEAYKTNLQESIAVPEGAKPTAPGTQMVTIGGKQMYRPTFTPRVVQARVGDRTVQLLQTSREGDFQIVSPQEAKKYLKLAPGEIAVDPITKEEIARGLEKPPESHKYPYTKEEVIEFENLKKKLGIGKDKTISDVKLGIIEKAKQFGLDALDSAELRIMGWHKDPYLQYAFQQLGTNVALQGKMMKLQPEEMAKQMMDMATSYRLASKDFRSADEVKAARDSGRITQDEALKILMEIF